ncbi:hypothetical protein BA950_09265 [Erythrobacter sp. SAORIC-644]|uniref:N-6 DNA methylase n=1 Tax=Erythrobacter sp. SAORIC-644 TaxID=1869314 RepID=UPI000C9FDBF8|nr:N-6 DNA methylase [Erythrobacter sp. SAORIC-644]PNQ76000.1 hypothetical protein BA950_09265 [Erythrobacter sp. SAORIC-644]
MLEVSRKKELGAFYTSAELSNLITDWAIKSVTDTVLEPSFGKCGFLRSARDRLLALGRNQPTKSLYGCDIDSTAFNHLSTVLEQPVDLTRFHEGDFLEQGFPESWPSQFTAVIGNPPYLPHRRIPKQHRDFALNQLKKLGLRLDRRASLWAYFVALSVPYTLIGGRAAWVLPSSFLYANYSAELRRFIAINFSRSRAFELKERQFILEGTEEKTVVLLCEGRLSTPIGQDAIDIPLEQCAGLKDLDNAISRWRGTEASHHSSCASSVFDSLSNGPKNVFESLQEDRVCRSLGDFLKVQIGLVTGNNQFFLLDEPRRHELNISAAELVRVLPRFRYALGAQFDHTDHDALVRAGGKGYMINVASEFEVSAELHSYLGSYPEREIKEVSTFKKREVWCEPDDGKIPDAFFPVMHHLGPRLVINSARISCTNSVHRAYFRSDQTQSQKQLLALSLLTSFSQVSAEVCGRSYGSGALKHEPREAEKIRVLMPYIHHKTIGAAFRRADEFLRSGHLSEARQIADQTVLTALGVKDIPATTATLLSGLAQLRDHRHR